METKVIINGKEFKVKLSLKNLFVYERLRGYGEMITLEDKIVYIYATLLVHNESFEMTFDEFMKALDEDQSILNQFAELYKTLDKPEEVKAE